MFLLPKIFLQFNLCSYLALVVFPICLLVYPVLSADSSHDDGSIGQISGEHESSTTTTTTTTTTSSLINNNRKIDQPVSALPSSVSSSSSAFLYWTSKSAPKYFVKVGQSLKLECSVKGRPIPRVYWLKNNVPINAVDEQPPMESMINRSDFLTSPSMALISAKYVIPLVGGTDHGTYKCVAVNNHTSLVAKTWVIVGPVKGPESRLENFATFCRIQEVRRSPMIVVWSHSTMARIGDPVILQCKLRQPTESRIIWYDSNGQIVKSNYNNNHLQYQTDGKGRQIYTVNRYTGDLLIHNVSSYHMGNYICAADNKYGKDVIQSYLFPVEI